MILNCANMILLQHGKNTMKTKNGHCKTCGNVGLKKDVRKIGCAAHFFFLMLFLIGGLLTGGLGLIVIVPLWILCACYDNSKWQCSICYRVV